MKLGVSWFTYQPQWKNNRDLPEDERLSLQIRRLRPMDLYADEDEAVYTEWRDTVLKKAYGETEHWAKITSFPHPILGLLKRLTTHTRNWQNFEFEDGVKTDPIDIALNLPSPVGTDQSESLLFELTTVLSDTANMTADEVKNYNGPAGGGP